MSARKAEASRRPQYPPTIGNTRAVCRRCYIHPRVVEAWAEGRLGEELRRVKARLRRDPAPLSVEEAVVLRWLERPEG